MDAISSLEVAMAAFYAIELVQEFVDLALLAPVLYE
jgi:hypothetical protein